MTLYIAWQYARQEAKKKKRLIKTELPQTSVTRQTQQNQSFNTITLNNIITENFLSLPGNDA